jgi:hypothetical protein
MGRRSILRVLTAAACCCATAPALAQSINIDLGPPGTEPPSSYRAAGMPGQWQKFEATTWGEFHDLVDLDGNAIPARESGSWIAARQASPA